MRSSLMVASLVAASFLPALSARAGGCHGPRAVFFYRPMYSVTYPWTGYIPGGFYIGPAWFHAPPTWAPPPVFPYAIWYPVPFVSNYTPPPAIGYNQRSGRPVTEPLASAGASAYVRPTPRRAPPAPLGVTPVTSPNHVARMNGYRR